MSRMCMYLALVGRVWLVRALPLAAANLFADGVRSERRNPLAVFLIGPIVGLACGGVRDSGRLVI